MTEEGRVVKARLRLIFTQINANSPDRKFYFTICVNEVSFKLLLDLNQPSQPTIGMSYCSDM